ncbi:S1 family peptidase [Saccharothrix saharensis]|uniref:S1 family peptidase n=1 Tax=Saccharothrix saharensis TaxID=571190 RepID=UPI0036808D19
MSGAPDPFRGPAEELALAVAGDDDARFILAFQTFLNQARSLADADDPALLTKSMLRRGAAEVRAAPRSRSREENGLYGDRTYLRNARAMAANRKRIVGGTRTSGFPDCVAVGSTREWCCSGTLVAPNVVLTAAHCVGQGCGKRVFFGDDVEFPDEGEVVGVRSAVVAPQYASSTGFGDIAVLVLDESVDVAPRKIARPGALDDATFVRVAGYGNTDVQGKRGYGIRRQVDVPLAGTSEEYGADFATEFVAGAPFLDLDSCSGDSGGPAYVSVDGEWLLAGATSRAIGGKRVRRCGDGGVYTRVCEYEDWIRSVPGGKW